MDSSLKQRLVGATVLVALAVIFLPMLVKGPAPDSGVSDVSLEIPSEPRDDSAARTVDLPLMPTPGVPQGGVVGMPAGAQDNDAVDSSNSPFPTAAAGDYAVSFGSYATVADAAQVIAALRKAGLPAFSDAIKVNGRDAQRVRIGPFADRAVAESARLAAGRISAGVEAKVVALDGGRPVAVPMKVAEATVPAPSKPEALPPVVKPTPPPAPSAVKPVAIATPATPPPPAVSAPAPVAKPAADTSKTGFAVQVGAFADAAAATALRDKLRSAGFNTFTDTVNTEGGMRTRVRVGPVVNRAEADALSTSVKAKMGLAGMVRPHP